MKAPVRLPQARVLSFGPEERRVFFELRLAEAVHKLAAEGGTQSVDGVHQTGLHASWHVESKIILQ